MSPRSIRLVAAAGGLGSLVIVAASAIAALAYTGDAGERYSPLNHFISDLGEVGVSELAVVFNAGLVVGGGLLGAFLVGLGRLAPGRWAGPVAGAGAVAGIAGALVGIFPVNSLGPHVLAALMFFYTGWIAVALFAAATVRHPEAGFPRWLLVPAAATVVAFLVFNVAARAPGQAGASPLVAPSPRPDLWPLATFEWATLAGVLAWSACVALVLVRRAAAAEHGEVALAT